MNDSATKAKVLWTLAIGLGIAAIFVLTGGSAMDRQGWAYSCPAPLRMFTDTGFIVIDPNYGGDGPDYDVIVGRGEPDGRRVYYRCRQSAGRRVALSGATLLGALIVAGYFVARVPPSDPTPAPSTRKNAFVEPEPAPRVIEPEPAPRAVVVPPRTIPYTCGACGVVSHASIDQPNAELRCRECGNRLRGAM